MSITRSDGARRGREKILVTGMPRSGTTWLARLLATAPGSALAGREPMNPRGRQWALAGTLDGWARLTAPSGRQQRALSRAYRGLSPSVYSRYGLHQWRAPLPWSRLIMKDPFAMLSTTTVHAHTGARPVLIHRHPGAMLVSYRRMGWQPDIAELAPLMQQFRAVEPAAAALVAPLPDDADPNGVAAMAWFWSSLYAMAITDVQQIAGGLVVAHERIATDEQYCREVHRHLGVPWSDGADAEFAREASQSIDPEKLHNFNRRPADAAVAWRAGLPETDIAVLERLTAPVRDLLERASFRVRSP